MTSSTTATTAILGALLASACSATPPSSHPEADATDTQAPERTGTSPPPGPALAKEAQGPDDRFVTRAHAGHVLVMHVGETRTLSITEPAAPEPSASGDAVELVAMVAIQAGTERSWEVRAVRPGRSIVAVRGARPFAVTIDVVPR